MRPSARCLLLTPILGFLLASPAGAKPEDLKSWARGPVRYIAEAQELKVFKKLRSDEDRALFIERFWARRDPTPATLANEYRQLFWERIQEANGLFLDSHKPGWMTDRGKIYVLYGPPTRVEEHQDLDTHSGPTAGHGLIRWVYEGRPAERTDLDPVVVVPFVRQASGEYRISYDPKLASVFFDALAVEEQQDRAIERFLEIFGAPRPTELSVMLDLGKMQEVPPQAQVLMERIETVEAYRTHPVDAEVSRYLHPDARRVVAVVTVDLGVVAPGTTPAVIARFRPRDATQGQRMLGEDSFRTTEIDGRRLAQGRLLLDPGTYDVTVLVADPVTASTGMHRAALRVGEPSDRLRLSDLTWAAELSPLEYAALASHDEPFLVGPFRVVPHLSNRFRPGDSVRLFHEVYGGVPPYRISYRLEGLELDGTWVRLGGPSVREATETAHGWEVTTSADWPVGEYRVRVEVEDAGEQIASAQIEFRLVEESGGGEASPDRDAAGSGP